ncbi:hypothetical protein FORC36_3883 [Vibrio vulnificus]|nr:hypothetical protein FORC36_3883 [Vibrio vulnificus]
MPPQHILFRTEKLTSEELANINHAWLEENAVTLDIEQLVSIRQTDSSGASKRYWSHKATLKKSQPQLTQLRLTLIQGKAKLGQILQLSIDLLPRNY